MTKTGNSQIMRTITLLIAIFSLSLPAYAQYSGGTGDPNDPYQIATAEDLMLLGETPEDYDKHFILTSDIDLTGYVFDKAVIAPDTDPCDSDWSGFLFTGTTFAGVFDGNDHIVSHLTINGESYPGLFGSLGWPAEVKNLGVVDVNIVGSGSYIGGLAGESYGGTVTSCYSTGAVSGDRYVGGLVGGGSALTSCYSTTVVRGTSCVGGLVGFGGDMTNCYSTGVVSGDSTVGGLVGYDCGTITQSYSTALVRGTSDVGGLVGYDSEGIVTQCYGLGAVNGTGDNVGGLVGFNEDGAVSDCYSTGTVTGNDNVGGLVGCNCGYLSVSSLTHCYSTGMVTGAGGNLGGLVGSNNEYGVVTACFWDIETSGQATSAAGTGKTTAEMQTASTFSDWGLCEGAGVWAIDEGHDYPRLSWEYEPGQPIQSSLSDFLEGHGTQDDPYLIYTLADVKAIERFPCEWDKHFRLMFVSGTGTQDKPYLISTAEQLYLLGMLRHELNKHFMLTADIDLDPSLPGRRVFDKAVIAPDTDPCDLDRYGGPIFNGVVFGGIFDGNGHVISHLTVKGASYLGLFGQLGSGAEVKSLGLVDVNIAGSGSYVGGLAAYCLCCVANCYSTGAVSGTGYAVGGLVGENYWLGTVTHSYSSVSVSGTSWVAGLVGVNRDGTVTQCYSVGAVSTTALYGFVGGLVGSNDDGTVTNSFWDTQASGQPHSGGGTGKTTAEMQDVQTYRDAGWDFAGEIEDGLHEIWQMPKEGGYPVLAIFNGYVPPQLQEAGTAENPYLISSAEELGAMAYYSPRAHYRLTASIDLLGILWDTSVIPWFYGSFDGDGHVISHLTIAGSDYVGLFGRLYGNVVNLGVVDVNVLGSGDYVGGLAGENSYNTVVADCHAAGSVIGGSDVGGLVGYNDHGDVTCCYSTVTVIGTGWRVGGLAGYNSEGAIAQCYSTGAVSGRGGVGGLIGHNRSDYAEATVTQCYSTGAVSGSSDVGGLVGYNNGIVTQCYSAGAVGANDRVGGVVGSNNERRYAPTWVWVDGIVSNCFWDIQTSGQTESDGGTGLTTAEMQTASTFLDAGWDFVDETANGTEDIWWILEGQDYPRLWWELGDETSP